MTTHPAILIAGRAAADAICQRAGMGVTAVISIVDEGERVCHGFESVPRRLRLEMDDAAGQAGGPGRYSPRPPTREQAREIIEFARSIGGAGGTLLCHCNAGLSRSPAAALICLATWLPPGAEREAAERIARIRPGARPHGELVRFADDLLARDGALVAAAAAFGR